jgi:hypothetical protein
MKSILEGSQAFSIHGGESFETPNQADDARPLDLPADESHGHDFIPFNVEEYNVHINILSLIPLELFEFFVSICLVYRK